MQQCCGPATAQQLNIKMYAGQTSYNHSRLKSVQHQFLNLIAFKLIQTVIYPIYQEKPRGGGGPEGHLNQENSQNEEIITSSIQVIQAIHFRCFISLPRVIPFSCWIALDGWKNWKSCKAFLFSVFLQGSVHACPHQVFVSIGTGPGSFVALNVEHCCLGPAGQRELSHSEAFRDADGHARGQWKQDSCCSQTCPLHDVKASHVEIRFKGRNIRGLLAAVDLAIQTWVQRSSHLSAGGDRQMLDEQEWAIVQALANRFKPWPWKKLLDVSFDQFRYTPLPLTLQLLKRYRKMLCYRNTAYRCHELATLKLLQFSAIWPLVDAVKRFHPAWKGSFVAHALVPHAKCSNP